MKSYKAYIVYIIFTSVFFVVTPGDLLKTTSIFYLLIFGASLGMTVYMIKNWDRGADFHHSSKGFGLLFLFIGALCMLLIENYIAILNIPILFVLSAILFILFTYSLEVYGYINTAGFIIPSGIQYHPYGSNISPINKKESMDLLSKKTGIPIPSLPEEAKLIAEECWHFPIALSIISNILRLHPEQWGTVLSLLQNHDNDKYASCAGEKPYRRERRPVRAVCLFA